MKELLIEFAQFLGAKNQDEFIENFIKEQDGKIDLIEGWRGNLKTLFNDFEAKKAEAAKQDANQRHTNGYAEGCKKTLKALMQQTGFNNPDKLEGEDAVKAAVEFYKLSVTPNDTDVKINDDDVLNHHLFVNSKAKHEQELSKLRNEIAGKQSAFDELKNNFEQNKLNFEHQADLKYSLKHKIKNSKALDFNNLSENNAKLLIESNVNKAYEGISLKTNEDGVVNLYKNGDFLKNPETGELFNRDTYDEWFIASNFRLPVAQKETQGNSGGGDEKPIVNIKESYADIVNNESYSEDERMKKLYELNLKNDSDS